MDALTVEDWWPVKKAAGRKAAVCDTTLCFEPLHPRVTNSGLMTLNCLAAGQH